MTDESPESPPAGQPEAPLPETSVQIAAATLGKDLLEAMVQELHAIPEWEQLSQVTQDHAIARLRSRVQMLVGMAIQIIFRGNAPVTPATLLNVAFGKSIKATLDISRRAMGRHELTDAIGQQVLVVMLNPDEYTARMDEIKARDKQGDLFTSGVAQSENYTGGDGRPFRRDEPGMGDAPDTAERFEDVDPEDTGDLELERPPLWKQCHVALTAMHIPVLEAEVGMWTEDQLTAAMFWTQQMEEDPTNGPLRPRFIPAPVEPIPDDTN